MQILNNTSINSADYVLHMIQDLESRISGKGYRGVKLLADFIADSEAVIGDSYVKLCYCNDNRISKANLLVRYTSHRYLQYNNLESDLSFESSDINFVNSVGDLNEKLN